MLALSREIRLVVAFSWQLAAILKINQKNINKILFICIGGQIRWRVNRKWVKKQMREKNLEVFTSKNSQSIQNHIGKPTQCKFTVGKPFQVDFKFNSKHSHVALGASLPQSLWWNIDSSFAMWKSRVSPHWHFLCFFTRRYSNDRDTKPDDAFKEVITSCRSLSSFETSSLKTASPQVWNVTPASVFEKLVLAT